MKRFLRILPVIAFCLAADVGISADRIELVIDNSSEMWQPLGKGPPRYVALREALLDYAAASVFGDQNLEIGLWVVGGEGGASDIDGCGAGGAIQVTRALDPQALQSILPEFRPGGVRALAQALSGAAGSEAPPRRIVLITSGGDQCHRDVAGIANQFLNTEPAVELRIIGLSLDREMADAAALLAPTRNVGDPSKLSGALGWALGATEAENRRAAEFSFDLGQMGAALEGFEAELTNSESGKTTFANVESGVIRTRLVPGRYRASIPLMVDNPIELSGLVTTSSGSEIELVLSPAVTLEVVAPEPARGEPVFVQFWGAPNGVNWVTLAVKASPLGFFLARTEARGESDEVELPPSAVSGELEIRFLHEPTFGVYQLLGRLPLELLRGEAGFKAPKTVEIGSRFELLWKGPNLLEDRITITFGRDEATDHTVCLYAASGGPQPVVAPASPGNYAIRYHSATGEILASTMLEVFEVLATLEAPPQFDPDREVEVSWTGPDGFMDFLSIANPEAAGDEYVNWSPTKAGNPLQIRTPTKEGDYELRYVRGENAEILARQSLKVISTPVEIEVPGSVDSGTRFAVQLIGTPSQNDIVAIAEVGSDLQNYFDWSYATTKGQLTLAAPFDPGDYEIRYIAGGSREIVTRIPIRVR